VPILFSSGKVGLPHTEKDLVFAKVIHFFHNVLSEFGVIPLVDGCGEALFFRSMSSSGIHPDGLLQNVLSTPLLGFYRFGNAHRQLHELVVEKWDTRFQATAILILSTHEHSSGNLRFKSR